MTTRVERVHAPDRFVTCRRPLFLMPVSAGFPSPADDYLEEIYPSIRLAAEALTRWRDPKTGLHKPAYEDDNPALEA